MDDNTQLERGDIVLAPDGYKFQLLSEWPTPIPVTERLPQDDVPILAAVEGYEPWIPGVFQESQQLFNSGLVGIIVNAGRVTHWLPLPPKPE